MIGSLDGGKYNTNTRYHTNHDPVVAQIHCRGSCIRLSYGVASWGHYSNILNGLLGILLCEKG